MTNLSIADQKNALRKNIRLKLKSLSSEELQISSHKLCAKISDWINARPHIRTITSFAHLPYEPDLSSLHELLPDIKIAYPHATKGGAMDFYHVTCPSNMPAGYYGLRQPVPEDETKISSEEIDLVLCPAFAFTITGERLGKGGGYYDRFLAQLSSECHILGIAMNCQIVSTIPTDHHDILVHEVLTP